jgi:hypothetical protein
LNEVTSESRSARGFPRYATATNSLVYARASAESAAVVAAGYTELRMLKTSVESGGNPEAADPMMNATPCALAATIGASVPPWLWP